VDATGDATVGEEGAPLEEADAEWSYVRRNGVLESPIPSRTPERRETCFNRTTKKLEWINGAWCSEPGISDAFVACAYFKSIRLSSSAPPTPPPTHVIIIIIIASPPRCAEMRNQTLKKAGFF
jgi:hypothetical protein